MITAKQVRDLIRAQSADSLTATNDRGISLKQALVPPQRISVIERMVHGGRMNDQKLEVWLVGQESPDGGYKIIMGEDGSRFGLAGSGFPADEHLVLIGWYGSLMSAFLGM